MPNACSDPGRPAVNYPGHRRPTRGAALPQGPSRPGGSPVPTVDRFPEPKTARIAPIRAVGVADAGDERVLLFVQNVKGAFFAIGTGAALYFAIAAALARQRRLAREKERVEQMLSISQRLEAIGHHAATVVHDFNNLILVVRGLTQLAREEANVPPRISEHLEQIEATTAKAEDVVRQLAQFLRKKPPGLVPLDLCAVARDFLPLLRQVLTRSITFDADLRGHSPVVIAERSQIEQVLLNLAINARDAVEHSQKKAVSLSVHAVTLDGSEAGLRSQPAKGRAPVFPSTFRQPPRPEPQRGRSRARYGSKPAGG